MHNRPCYSTRFPSGRTGPSAAEEGMREKEKNEFGRRQEGKIEQVQEDLWVTGIVDDHEGGFIVKSGAPMRTGKG